MSGKKLILPSYHLVNDKNPSHIYSSYAHKSIADFSADLDYLLAHFKPISLQELIYLKKNNKSLPSTCFHLSFNDGLSDFYHTIAPLLIEKKIPATVFLNADFIDNKDLFYKYKASILANELSTENLLNFSFEQQNELDELAQNFGINWNDYLQEHRPYLTTPQIEELIKQGFTFGSHSNNHPLYSNLTLDEQLEQTLYSTDFIVKKFKLDYKVFSFPFTDYKVSKAFFQHIKKQRRFNLWLCRN